MDLIQAFDQITTSMREAEVSRSRTVAEVQAEQCGLEKVEPGPAGQRTHWQRVEGAGRLVLCSRWYDPSQAFSVQPDINVLTLELFDGEHRVRQLECRFED